MSKENIKNQIKIVETVELLAKESTKAIGRNTYMIDEVAKTQSWIIKLVENLYKLVAFIFIMLNWILFLQEPFQKFLSPIEWWSKLSEAWKIFFVGIPTLIFVHIVGSVIFTKYYKKNTPDN